MSSDVYEYLILFMFPSHFLMKGNYPQVTYDLGCRFPVNSADFWLRLRKFCGEADRGRLAGQRREFKIHRKSTAQKMSSKTLQE